MSNVATQFKPGQSGNPKGAPKRNWTWRGLLEESMEEEDETGVPFKKIITKKVRSLGAKGDMMAVKEIFNRMDGMPTEYQDVTTRGSFVIVKPEKKPDGAI